LSQENVNNGLISSARLLFSKGTSFCLYRYPNSLELNLAIEKKTLPGGNTFEFIIAPFIPSAECPTVILRKIDAKSFDENDVQTQLAKMPDQEIQWAPLPKATAKSEYFQRIEGYLNEIKSGNVSKAILSRVLKVSKPVNFDPFILFETLSLSYPETFTNLFYIPGKGLWMGASPEMLLQKNGNVYQTMALAATQPKNSNHLYQWGSKEKEEHQMVRKHIEKVFAKNNCSLVSSKGPYAFETGKVAHLKTDYVFEGKIGTELSSVIRDLHPTPAIGGLPVKAALNCIKNHEGYSRNYYAGYLGETNESGLARFFINLRCMQIGENEIAVFSGGGITADSDPSEEWEETVQKSLTLLEKLEQGINTQHAL
jgi:isochorismate synthase